ncbi:cob(I)yrinic acid a,c-diamide adenosyltransferase [Pectinatus haikarae]|uniref:Corrinoid adenosyltransferase n=1 Tax=Pectinatus haikarae TaxID=349096 RepID=A0ABT9Y4J3_9FIRM|nr:cob(I)yrinic acid a,c-diamide adenosyltransferase [Pectinatus haikarae]MDQ0202750.1 cob(I)alamin adenosyltransferase [Pectinatus haikarae]
MSICTKTGDKGETSLYTGQRIAKNSLRVESYGSVDEINSALAMARASSGKPRIKKIIKDLQQMNMALMADLASIDAKPRITEKDVGILEDLIAELEKTLPPLKAFIIPGDTLCGAFLDSARTAARRAERRALTLSQSDESAVALQDKLFLNRLSDLCFLLMRFEETEK